MKGFIYKIISDNHLPYYGSTFNLKERKWSHITAFNSYKKGKSRFCYSFLHLECPSYKFIEIETVDVYNKTELLKIETDYILNNDCINVNIPYVSEEIKRQNIINYRELNRERNKQYQKQYKIDKPNYKENQEKLKIKVICPLCLKKLARRTFLYQHKKCYASQSTLRDQ